MNERDTYPGKDAGTALSADTSFEVFDSLNHPVCVIGLDGDIIYANGRFSSFFDDAGGSMSIDLSHPFSPEYRKSIALAYTRAIRGADRRCFAVMRTPDDRRIAMEIHLFPMFRAESVVSILAFLKPVSDDRIVAFGRNAAIMTSDDEPMANSGIFDFAPFPIVRFDRKGSIVGGSASVEAFFGHSLADLQTNRNLLFRSVALYDFERLRKAVSDVFDGRAAFRRLGEIRVLSKSREEKWANAIIYPLMINREIFAVETILEDITRIKSLESRMSMMNRVQIIGDLTKGLLHSFNNIINIILSRTQLLLQVTEKDTVLEGLKVIEKTAGQGVRQVRRIQDFMDEGDSLRENESEDLIDIIEDAIEFANIHFKVEIKERRRHIKVERRYFCLVNVKTDTRLLREILISMIFKAASHLRRGGTINVMLKDEETPALTVMVKKEGSEPEPVREAERESLGTIIFSAIDIRRVVERLNIKIIEEESATSYSIRAVLPSAMVAGKGRKEAEPAEYRVRDRDIIIVEDEKALKEILFELFDSMGNRVSVFESGEEALAEFRKGKANMVISDYGTKGITGIELLTRVKELDENAVTVLLSGWMIKDLKAYRNVVDLYLPKPFKLDVLIKEISKVLKNGAK
ncbi:MAG TPA: response regulator [Spirochaetota bacterium]|nr:MAG: Sporulation initiation phosphotransferase F [Spirochaetes bacterium ADurb.BinA120]HPI13275.1 response regulator [Spirochaetota bacterium]HPO44284.1 response regulator [Spirochaetota bacterium]